MPIGTTITLVRREARGLRAVHDGTNSAGRQDRRRQEDPDGRRRHTLARGPADNDDKSVYLWIIDLREAGQPEFIERFPTYVGAELKARLDASALAPTVTPRSWPGQARANHDAHVGPEERGSLRLGRL